LSFYNLTETDRLVDIAKSHLLIKGPDLAAERDLANKKWFGYRFMSPLALTMHFAELYIEGVRAHVHMHCDAELAENVRGLATNIFSEPSGSLTQLWRARQRADALGVPYDLLIEFGFNFASRRKWRRTPRPVQLFGTKKSDFAWEVEFEKFRKERYPLALVELQGLPQYQSENYDGLPAQDDLRAALVELISRTSGSWSTTIGRHCIGTRHLPLEETLKLVPEEMRDGVMSDINRDLELGLLEPAQSETLPMIAYAPACCGIPATRDVNLEPCQSCRFAQQCGALADKVASVLQQRAGSTSPVENAAIAKRRESDRRRQQRHRKRRAEALAGDDASIRRNLREPRRKGTGAAEQMNINSGAATA